MDVMDYLVKPNRNIATPDEDQALREILEICGSANTALLQLYRASVLAAQEYENLVDEIERFQKLHHEEVLRLKGEPAIEARDFERCLQPSQLSVIPK